MSINKINKNIAIIAIFLLCYLHAVAMHEFVPTIRYDRVWECTTSYNLHTFIVKYMKFDGTEEINGKIYHRIVTFKKAIMERRYDPFLDTYEYIDGLCEIEGYMREDNGKVYTLATGEYCYGSWYGSLYTSEKLNDTEIVDEFLIYDFTCEPGQKYEALSNLTGSNELVNFTVVSKTPILINNEECFHMIVEYEGCTPSPQIIEGIGPILFGCLNYQEHAVPTMMWEYNYFNRIFDINGKVLYGKPDSYDYKLPENLFSSVDEINDYGQFQFDGKTIAFGIESVYNSVTICNSNGCLMKTVSSYYPISISTSDLTPGIYLVFAQTYNCPPIIRKIIVR